MKAKTAYRTTVYSGHAVGFFFAPVLWFRILIIALAVIIAGVTYCWKYIFPKNSWDY